MGKKVVLITGASGNIGKASIQALGAYADSLDVRAGVRSPGKPDSAALASLGPNVSVVAADPTSPDFPAALEGVDYLYVVTPGSLNRTEVAVGAINGAKAKGIKFILVISVFTTPLSDTLFGKQFQPIEKALGESGISYAVLRLPFFIDNTYGHAGTIKEQGAFYGPVIPDKPLTAVATKDVGEVAAKILSNPEPHGNKIYKLSSPVYTYEQLAKIFSDVLGKPVNYVQVSHEATRKSLLGFGFQDWQVDGIEDLNKAINEGNPNYVDYDAPKTIQTILGRPPITIEEWVKEAAPVFK